MDPVLSSVETSPLEVERERPWGMVGTGDFNVDGRPDILWRHAVSGQNAIWFMDGINRVRGTFTTPSTQPDTNWNIVGPR